MMDADDVTFMREEIKRQVQLVLFGSAGTNTQLVEDIQEMIPGMATIPTRPVMHPYGFASRAIMNTISCVIRCGDHAGNRMVFGHRDQYRPSDLNEGETAIYSSKYYQVRVSNTGITIGFTTDNTMSGFSNQANISLSNESGQQSVGVNAPQVTLGNNASQGAGLGTNIENRLTALETEWKTFITAYNLHVHPTAAPGPPSTPVPPSAPFTPAQGAAASSTIQVAT